MSAKTQAVAQHAAPALPEPVARRGIDEAAWRTLCNSLYPGAASESVLMVWDYCKARKLDPLKKPCHIVPINVKDAKTGQYGWRDTVMPGIYELRTTAVRTGTYLGHSEPEYGPEIEYAGVTAPEWCRMVFYRWHAESRMKIEIPVRVKFRECVATKKDGTANDRWSRAPEQMLTKCTEAAGLREGWPDEVGGQYAAEEMYGRTIEGEATPVNSKPATEQPKAAEGKADAPNVVPLGEIQQLIDRTGIPETDFLHRFEIDCLESLPLSRVTEALEYLRSLNAG